MSTILFGIDLTTTSTAELLATNTEITDIVDKIPLASGIRDNIHLLTDESAWMNVLVYLQNNQWIFATLLIVSVFYVLSIIFRMNRQKRSESRITNMFNEDGSKNEHHGRRVYHVSTPIFISILIAFAWFAIATIRI